MKIENIKFKAKRLDNGEWVKGSLVNNPIGTVIVWWEDSIENIVDVDPSTICQYTGLKDCNGREVWEGDYLSSIYSYPEHKKVEFKNGAFGLDTYYRGQDFLPLACCDIRAGCLVEFELDDRKEDEK